MDNNDSIKSQQTGGLKLMTVFISVLALHVVVIGGFTVYHLMSGGSGDADVATTDKTHKTADGTMMGDNSSPSTSAGDKNTPATTPSTDATTTPANPPAPATDQVAAATTEATAPAAIAPLTPAPLATPTIAAVPAPTPTPAPTLTTPPTLTLNTPKTALLTPPSAAPTAQTPSGPIAPSLMPPPDVAPASTAPVAAGPVHMPSVASTPAAPKVEHEHQQTYTVKITDSFKKIAKAHHITVAELKEANHIKGDTLHTGQKLVIPSKGSSIVATTTSSTGTETTPTRTVLTQSTESLSAVPTDVATTGKHHHLYTVAKGDTLAKIAHKFKTTPLAIMEINDIADPAKLAIGTKLRIPSREARSAKITPSAPAQPSQAQAVEPIQQPQAVQPEQYEPTPSSGELANFTP